MIIFDGLCWTTQAANSRLTALIQKFQHFASIKNFVTIHHVVKIVHQIFSSAFAGRLTAFLWPAGRGNPDRETSTVKQNLKTSIAGRKY